MGWCISVAERPPTVDPARRPQPRSQPRPYRAGLTLLTALTTSLLATVGIAACGDATRDRETVSARSNADDGNNRVDLRDAPKASATVVAPARLNVGRLAPPMWIAAVDIDVNPSGVGLPAGRGTHADGALLYAARCAACHGARGEGLGTYPRLVGPPSDSAFRFGTDAALVKTVGNYWPYATTLYDYIHRAMPWNAPGSLAPSEVYSLVAYLLAENKIVDRNAVVDSQTLPLVRMPALTHFIQDDRRGGPGFR